MEKMHQKFPSMLGRKSLFVSPRKLIKDIKLVNSPRLQTEKVGLPKTTLEDILSIPKCIINKVEKISNKKTKEFIVGLQLISLGYNHDPVTGRLNFNSPAMDIEGNNAVMIYQLTIVIDTVNPQYTKASLHLLYEDSIYNDNPHKFAFLNRLEQTSTHTRDNSHVLETPHIHIPSPKNIITNPSETALTSLYHCLPEIYSTEKLLIFEQIINSYYEMYNIQNDVDSAIDLTGTIPSFIRSQEGKKLLDTSYRPVIIDNAKREEIIKSVSPSPSQLSKKIKLLAK